MFAFSVDAISTAEALHVRRTNNPAACADRLAAMSRHRDVNSAVTNASEIKQRNWPGDWRKHDTNGEVNDSERAYRPSDRRAATYAGRVASPDESLTTVCRFYARIPASTSEKIWDRQTERHRTDALRPPL